MNTTAAGHKATDKSSCNLPGQLVMQSDMWLLQSTRVCMKTTLLHTNAKIMLAGVYL